MLIALAAIAGHRPDGRDPHCSAPDFAARRRAAGLLLLGWTGLYLVSVRQEVDLIPLWSDPFGAGFEAMLFNGILAAAGMGMILRIFVPSR